MDSENINSPMQSSQQQQQQPENDNTPVQSPGSRSSIYSPTLDELKNTLSESGENFSSTNMDEFLTSIWTAEENQIKDQEQARGSSPQTSSNILYATAQRTENALRRQGSLTVPARLCSKTIDEVWSEIRKAKQGENNNDNSNVNPNPNPNPTATQRQTTFGDMTLEDFFVKAGIIRPAQNFAPYNGMTQQQNMAVNVVPPPVGPSAFNARSPMVEMGNGNVINYQPDTVYPHQRPLLAVGYRGRMVNGGEGFGMPSGRKQVRDGPVEVVVERRQRRMIKNRVSAARSRARKQAYTVELEAELNKLKAVNEQLRQTLDGYERDRRQQCNKEEKPETQTQSKAQKVREKLRAIRRTSSCHY